MVFMMAHFGNGDEPESSGSDHLPSTDEETLQMRIEKAEKSLQALR
jgi:hypothetical protein